jgi:hypothetical protein
LKTTNNSRFENYATAEGGAIDLFDTLVTIPPMVTHVNSLSIDQLKRAIAIKEQIAELERELENIQGVTPKTASMTRPKKRAMSAAAKAAISASQKARWAERKQVKTAKPEKVRAAKKPRMSPEKRAKLQAAAKAFWAKKKAEKATTAPVKGPADSKKAAPSAKA